MVIIIERTGCVYTTLVNDARLFFFLIYRNFSEIFIKKLKIRIKKNIQQNFKNLKRTNKKIIILKYIYIYF